MFKKSDSSGVGVIVKEVLGGGTSSSLYWVTSTSTLKECLEELVKRKIHSVPIYDTQQQKYVAFVDLLDFAIHIGSQYVENQLIEGNVWRLLEVEKRYTVVDIANESKRNPFITVDIDASLKHCLDVIVKHKLHRVAVAKNGQVTNILTLTDIIKYLHKHRSLIASTCKQTVDQLKLGYKQVISVNKNSKAFEAFLLIQSKGISGLAVVDDTSKLVGNISASDLKHINYDMEIMQKLSRTISDWNLPHPITVPPSATVEEVLAKLVNNHVQRVYVVDVRDIIVREFINLQQKDQLLGVISQIDIVEQMANDLH